MSIGKRVIVSTLLATVSVISTTEALAQSPTAKIASGQVPVMASPTPLSDTSSTTQASSTSDAATGTPPGAQLDGQLEDIVVTAERRSQRLQDVPIAATVLTADALAAQGVKNVTDLQQVAPSVAINTFGRSTFINIRGVGIALSAPSSNPGVAFYLDGQLIPHEQFIGQSFYDVSSIEVLRGPQGTLTGQNSTGGAIYVRTPDPKFAEYSGYLEQTIAEYGTYRTAGAINLGLSDNVALRIAGVHDERDSFTRNIGPSGRTPGNLNLDSVRLNLALRTSDERLKINIRGEYFNLDSDNIAVKNRNDLITRDPFTIEEDARSFLNQKGYRLAVEGRYDLSDGLQIRALTSLQKGRTFDLVDGDRTATARPRPPVNAVGRVTQARTEYDTFVNEVNLISTGSGPFQWVIGAFLLDERVPFNNLRDNTSTVNFVAPTSATIGELHNNSKSVFGQANWFLTPKIELIAGGRYSWDSQSFVGSTTLPAVYYTNVGDSKQLTGKIGLNYHFDRNLLIYGTYSKGYKAGGVNVIANTANFGPERNNVYEIGVKSELFKRHLRINADVFSSRYADIQFNSLLNGLPLLQNAARGKSQGGEVEITGQFGGFAVNGGLGYLDSKFSRSVCLNNTNNPAGTRTACPSTSATNADELVPSGRVLPYSPEWTINGGVQYTVNLGGESTLTPRLQWSHLSSQIATPFPSAFTVIPGRNVFDARLTLALANRYVIEGYITNLSNKTYIASQVQTSSSSDGGYVYGAPRQIGVRATIKFGE
jgi:iron complex outermembrane receptor protein